MYVYGGSRLEGAWDYSLVLGAVRDRPGGALGCSAHFLVPYPQAPLGIQVGPPWRGDFSLLLLGWLSNLLGEEWLQSRSLTSAFGFWVPRQERVGAESFPFLVTWREMEEKFAESFWSLESLVS
jgi:hypothetical protein